MIIIIIHTTSCVSVLRSAAFSFPRNNLSNWIMQVKQKVHAHCIWTNGFIARYNIIIEYDPEIEMNGGDDMADIAKKITKLDEKIGLNFSSKGRFGEKGVIDVTKADQLQCGNVPSLIKGR